MKLLALRLALTMPLLAAAPLGFVRAQQAPPPPPQPTRDVQIVGRGQGPVAVGTAMISGMVTMAGTGQPARKVRVNLSGAELRGNRSTNTDDQGRFSFTALPAGRFTLSVNKPGHLSVTYGQRRPGTPGTAIQLSDGQKFQAQLQIPRGSVLTGVVLDENGEATPGTNVRAMRFVRQGERRTLQSAGSGSTDDRGIYRIFGLQPGEYVVCATPRNNQMSDFERGQVEIQSLRESLTSLQASRANEEQMRAIEVRLSAIQAAAPQASDEPLSGYAPICYPGTLSTAEASPIALNVGEERPGIDFQLQLVPMARVEGMVLNSTGGQIQNLQVTLQEASALGNSFGVTQSARPDNEGRFRINNVAPGQYKLTARAQIGGPQGRGQFVIDGQPAPTGRGGTPATPTVGRGTAPALRPEPVTVWGAADVVVDGRNVSNVMLPLQLGMSVSGQLTFEGAIPPPTDLTRMRVTINSADPGPMSTNSSARVDASGRFSVQSVAPGRYRITASGAPGWFLESVTVGGQDALDFPFEVKPNQALGGVTVTFTDKQTELTGTVVDDKNQPAVDYTLVIFPADSRYWTGTTSRRIQTVRPGTDGRYTVRTLPPGDYKIATVLDMEPGSASDPAFLQQVEAATLRVTLQPGEKKQQDIRLSSR
jgi:protocatechuate 3,4-dioxygenase beta subunit